MLSKYWISGYSMQTVDASMTGVKGDLTEDNRSSDSSKLLVNEAIVG